MKVIYKITSLLAIAFFASAQKQTYLSNRLYASFRILVSGYRDFALAEFANLILYQKNSIVNIVSELYDLAGIQLNKCGWIFNKAVMNKQISKANGLHGT